MAAIKSIEREALAMKLAVIRLRDHVHRDATILTNTGVVARDLRTTIENLDGTYLIRLFAEFEVGLRSYWRTIKRSRPRAKDLMDGLAAHRGIHPNLLASAHVVREDRNRLVHDRTEGSLTVPLKAARSICCRFLSRLPADWT